MAKAKKKVVAKKRKYVRKAKVDLTKAPGKVGRIASIIVWIKSLFGK